MRKFALTSGLVVVLALVMGACGANGGPTKAADTAAPKAPTSTTTTTAAPPAPPTTTPTTAPAPAPVSSGSVPIYQPSSVVSQAGGHTQLSTSDDVAKVTAFYQQALSQDGWALSSSTKTAASANLVAKRSGLGVTVAIATAGPTGTTISVSTYPA